MVFEGEEAFASDIKDVWEALHNSEVLTRSIPGCRSMTALGNNVYAVSLSLGVAAVKGDYEGKVKVIDVKFPVHYIIEGEGAGAPGFVKLSMDCRLEPHAAGALMKWKCDATVGGLIASIGGKILSGISKFMAKQFFKAFKVEMGRLASSNQEDVERSTPSHRAAARPVSANFSVPLKHWFTRFWSWLCRTFSRQ